MVGASCRFDDLELVSRRRLDGQTTFELRKGRLYRKRLSLFDEKLMQLGSGNPKSRHEYRSWATQNVEAFHSAWAAIEGCDGILVLAPLGDASNFECFVKSSCSALCNAKQSYAKNLLAMSLGKEWINETPHKEELASLWESKDLLAPGRSSGLNAWMMAKLQESYHQAKQDCDQRNSIVQQIVQKRTDVSRRIIVPLEGQGGVTLSHVCLHCHQFPRAGYIWWVSTWHWKNPVQLWCTACSNQFK